MMSLKVKKIVAAVVAAITIGSVLQPGTLAAWKQDSNNLWSWTENGRNAKGWKLIDGVWYNFDQSGKMKTGWVNDNGTWYYLESSGAMRTGWVNDNGTWYYLQSSGAMKTGWAYDNGTWYYLQSSGAMKTGWAYDNGTWYYLQSSGAMKTGWINDNGTWYFAASSGAMQTGVVQVDGKVYYLASSGAMQTGNVVINGVTYNFDATGAAIGDKIPTPAVIFTGSGKVVIPSENGNGNSSGGGSSSGGGNSSGGQNQTKTFQEIINSKYNADTQITFNDYKADGVIKPNLNFTPGTEDLIIDGQECTVAKDIYITLNGSDAYISGNLETGYKVTGTGDINISATISVFSKTTGKLYYVTPKVYAITQ